MKIPENLTREKLENLRQGPGVYHFYGSDDDLLYVGKSKNIHDRVRDHFTNPGEKSKTAKIFEHIDYIETYPTAGDFGAQILELHHIKNKDPIYNKQSRKKKKMVVARLREDDDGYYFPELNREEEIKTENADEILAVFKSPRQAKQKLTNLAERHMLCPKRMQISARPNSRSCFQYQLGNCEGACLNKESVESYNDSFQQAFQRYEVKTWPFSGKKVIKEEREKRVDKFVIKNWCLISAETKLGDSKENFFTDNRPDLFANFNYDIYKLMAKKLLYE